MLSLAGATFAAFSLAWNGAPCAAVTPEYKLTSTMKCRHGKIVADFPIGAFVDATAFNHRLAFASCGDGTLTIVREVSADKFEVAETVTTEPGARTMVVDGHRGTVYLPTADLKIPPTTNVGNAYQRPIPVAGRSEF